MVLDLVELVVAEGEAKVALGPRLDPFLVEGIVMEAQNLLDATPSSDVGGYAQALVD